MKRIQISTSLCFLMLISTGCPTAPSVNISLPSSESSTAPGTSVPSAPVIGVARGGDGQASVTFSAPVSNGGSTITLYTVTSNHGQIATGTSSPIVVPGLTNGSSYTFSVTATNQVGTSAPSAASNSVFAATEADRVSAATNTVANNPLCSSSPTTGLGPYYWEIGDQSGVLASGSVGGVGPTKVLQSTVFGVASASKLIFGTYAVQRILSSGGSITPNQRKFLEMSGGFVALSDFGCAGASDVNACFTAVNTSAPDSNTYSPSGYNSYYSAADDGKFHYNGGHFQAMVADPGLLPSGAPSVPTLLSSTGSTIGTLAGSALAAEFQNVLGSDFVLSFPNAPLMAGGVNTSAGDYAVFLRKILSGELLMRDHLGENPVCTLPSVCSTSTYSPVPEAMHYSYGHWIEDDPAFGGDGAFSSAGMFGFYPWIDSTKTFYGVLSRKKNPSPGNTNQIGHGYASVQCGRLIRRAYLTGVEQTGSIPQ